MSYYYLSFITFSVAQIADWVVTVMSKAHGIPELNPFGNFLFTNGGYIAPLLVKIFLVVFAGYLLLRFERHSLEAERFIIAIVSWCAAATFLVVDWNLFSIVIG